MGKCCGFAIGCSAIIFVGVVITSYFGYTFLVGAGSEMAAMSFEKGSISIATDAFEGNDLQEVTSVIKELANEIREGKIGLRRFLGEAFRDKTEKEMFVDANVTLLAFKRRHIKNNSNLPDDINKNQSISLMTNILAASSANEMDAQSLYNLSRGLLENYEQTDTSNGTTMAYTYERLRQNIAPNEISMIINTFEQLSNEQQVKSAPRNFNASEAIKKDYIKLLESIRESSTTE